MVYLANFTKQNTKCRHIS